MNVQVRYIMRDYRMNFPVFSSCKCMSKFCVWDTINHCCFSFSNHQLFETFFSWQIKEQNRLRIRSLICQKTQLPVFLKGREKTVCQCQPFTQIICFNVATTSTRSLCAAITASIDLYAAGVSSSTPLSFRHSTPSVAR